MKHRQITKSLVNAVASHGIQSFVTHIIVLTFAHVLLMGLVILNKPGISDIVVVQGLVISIGGILGYITTYFCYMIYTKVTEPSTLPLWVKTCLATGIYPAWTYTITAFITTL